MKDNQNVWIWIIVAVVALLLFGSMGMGGYGVMGFGMGFGFISMLLFWGALIWLIITLVRTVNPQKGSEDAMMVLKKRYAAGEISKKEFMDMKKDFE